MAFGHIPAIGNTDNYHYISAAYLEILQRELPYGDGNNKPLTDRVARIMERFARTAESAGLFRLGQVWRVLASMVHLLLVRRGQYHLEKRLGVSPETPKDAPVKPKKTLAPSSLVDIAEEDTPMKRPVSRNLAPEHRNASMRSLLSQGIESTSNVPTPLAKPVEDPDGASDGFVPGKRLTPVIEPESFTLGPAAHPGLMNSPRKRHDSEPISVDSHGSGKTEESITEGYDFYDLEALSRAVDVPMSNPSSSAPRRSYSPQGSGSGRNLARHDSKESYGDMFSGSESVSTRMSVARGSMMGTSGLKHQNSDLSVRRGNEGRGASSEVSEYESRIRGQELQESPTRPARRRDTRQTESEDEMFLISQTTMGTDPYSQDSVPSQQSHLQQAYDTDNGKSLSESQEHRELMKPKPTGSDPTLSREESQVVIETDYLPWPNDPPYPHPISSTSQLATIPKTPIDPYIIITRALDYETRTSALHASAMILLLKPLVPDTVIDPFQALAILRQHHTRLMSMSLFVEAAHLRNLCVKGWPAGLPTWGETYAPMFAQAQQNVKVSFFCASCRKGRDVDPTDKKALWRCERCGARVAPCAVCGHRAMCEGGDLGSWWYCPGCAHGGHASCMEAWHADDNGACPLDGCGHACLPGRYRAEAGASRSEEVGRQVVLERRNPNVRGDGHEVAQSRAVETVREALGKDGKRRERRKSVKFAGAGS